MSKPRPGFWRNVVTVSLGTMGAQTLPLLVAPLLTRLCTPEDMGAFSVWLGVITVAGVGATLRVENAMVLDRDEQQQRTCLSVIAYSSTVLALLVTLAAVLGRALDWSVARHMSWLGLWTVGIGTWLTSYTRTTLAYAASHNLFAKAAKAKVWGAGTIALSQLALLSAGMDGSALLAGQLIGLLAGLAAAWTLLAPPRISLKLTLIAEQRRYLVRHQAFWRFSLPSSLLNTLVGQLPLFMIGVHHGAVAAGLFALTQRVLSAPIALLAAAILEVFKRQAAQDYQTMGSCREVYLYTFRALLLVGLGPCLILFLFSPDLFSFIFGATWRPAGELARILAPLCFLNVVASPLSYVFFVTGQQRIELAWQVALFLMTIAAFMAPVSLQHNVLLYSIGYSLLYLLYLYMSYQCSQNRLGVAWPRLLREGRRPGGPP